MKQVGYCYCWLSHTLWQRRKATCRETPAKENNVTQRCLRSSCLVSMRKKTALSYGLCVTTVHCSMLHFGRRNEHLSSSSLYFLSAWHRVRLWIVWLNGCFMGEQRFLLSLHSWWTVNSNFPPPIPSPYQQLFSFLHQSQSVSASHMSAKAIKR